MDFKLLCDELLCDEVLCDEVDFKREEININGRKNSNGTDGGTERFGMRRDADSDPNNNVRGEDTASCTAAAGLIFHRGDGFHRLRPSLRLESL